MAVGGTNAFLGLQPKIAPHLLDDRYASACSNVYLDNGYLKPLLGLSASQYTFSHNPKVIWKWEDNPYWVSSTDETLTITRAINPSSNKIYFSGAAQPKVGELGDGPTSIFTGAGPYPNGNNLFNLGVVKPGNAPLVSVPNPQPTAGRDYSTLDQETRYYIYTYVNEWGEESAASPPSAQITCYDDSHCALTLYAPGAAAGYKPIQFIRIYRSNTGTSTTAFQFVTQLTVATLTHTDTLKAAELSEPAETLLWEVPPVDLKNMLSVASQFFAGTRSSTTGYEVCFSEVLVPYAWPLAYRFPVGDEPVATAVNGSDLVVLTKGRPVVFVGNNPQAMQQIQMSEFQPCMNRRSVAVFNGMVVYAGADGLIGVSSSQGFVNLTESILTREQWAALGPADMQITVWERYLYITTPTSGYLFDLANKTYWPITVKFDAAFYDGYTDTLYVVQGDDLYKFNEGTPLTYSWTSKWYQSPAMSFVSGRVNALSQNACTFEYLIDGSVRLKRRITSQESFRLPALRGRIMYYRLSGTAHVRSAAIATSQGELVL